LFNDENGGVSLKTLAELCPVESQKFSISCYNWLQSCSSRSISGPTERKILPHEVSRRKGCQVFFGIVILGLGIPYGRSPTNQ